MYEIIKQFLIGGSFVSGITFLGNYVDPILAGLIAGIPIGLPTIYYVKSSKAHTYIKNLSVTTILLSSVTLLYYYLYVHLKWDKNSTIIFTMTIWFIVVLLIYWFQKKNHK